MRALVACEFSGVVAAAFRERGHKAISCDLLPCEQGNGNDWAELHHQGDVLEILNDGWDLMIAHPPCRYLNLAGVRWLYKGGRRWIKDKTGKVIGENPIDPTRWAEMEAACRFFLALLNCGIIPLRAVENSEMHPHALKIVNEKSTQEIQPWEHGHGESKATHLWLRGLPPLKPSNVVDGRKPRVHFASPGPDRWKERSRTLPGIAAAMAEQWGRL